MAEQRLSVRQIGNVSFGAGADRFDGSNGNEARGFAIYAGQVLAERFKRSPNRVYARLMMLFGDAEPVEFCPCERCRT